jgi:hypothetical protein
MCQNKMKRNNLFPSLPSLHLAGHNQWWIDTNTIDRYYWSCWLPIVSIYRLKIFHFWPIVLIIGSKKHFRKKIIVSIESNHRLKIFFSPKDHRSNRCFFTVNWLLVSMFFSPSVPTHGDGGYRIRIIAVRIWRLSSLSHCRYD